MAKKCPPETFDESVALRGVRYGEASARCDFVEELIDGAGGEFTPVVEDKLPDLTVISDEGLDGGANFVTCLLDQEVDVHFSGGAVREADDVLEPGVNAGWERSTQVDVHRVAELTNAVLLSWSSMGYVGFSRPSQSAGLAVVRCVLELRV